MRRRSFLTLLGLAPAAVSLSGMNSGAAIAARPQAQTVTTRSATKVSRQVGLPTDPVDGDIWINMAEGHHVMVCRNGKWHSAEDNLPKS